MTLTDLAKKLEKKRRNSAATNAFLDSDFDESDVQFIKVEVATSGHFNSTPNLQRMQVNDSAHGYDGNSDLMMDQQQAAGFDTRHDHRYGDHPLRDPHDHRKRKANDQLDQAYHEHEEYQFGPTEDDIASQESEPVSMDVEVKPEDPQSTMDTLAGIWRDIVVDISNTLQHHDAFCSQVFPCFSICSHQYFLMTIRFHVFTPHHL